MAEELRADLVFEGGGMKGIGLVGALSVIEEHGYRVERRAGSSAGALVAGLSAAGYSAVELHDLMLEADFTRFMDRGWEDRVPLAGAPLSVLLDLGIYEGVALEEWVAGLLEERGVRTFGDLRADYGSEEPAHRYKLQVVVSDVSAHRMLVLPRDSDEALGINPDELSVATALRASMSIPVLFEPVRLTDPRDGSEHVLVDGGMLSNFPVWVFDTPVPRWPTIGLLLVEGDPRSAIDPSRGAGSALKTVEAVRYAIALVQTMVEAHDRIYIGQADFARTVPIETLGVKATEFGLDTGRRERLFISGRRAAEEFLPFDFKAYVRAFRGPEAVPSRRDTVRSLLRETP